jgi:hypothetical protein
MADDKERLVRWTRDVEGLRKATELGVWRTLSSPPTINDFGTSRSTPVSWQCCCSGASRVTVPYAWATRRSRGFGPRWTAAPTPAAGRTC